MLFFCLKNSSIFFLQIWQKNCVFTFCSDLFCCCCWFAYVVPIDLIDPHTKNRELKRKASSDRLTEWIKHGTSPMFAWISEFMCTFDDGLFSAAQRWFIKVESFPAHVCRYLFENRNSIQFQSSILCVSRIYYMGKSEWMKTERRERGK